jgi:8-oxo-dGTP pyrophosphatase MutT (NUDIX family)
VFSIAEMESVSPEGADRTFYLLDSSSWAIVIPLLKSNKEKCFVMVRQWRHGADCISLEFPGGVIEKGESIEAGAARELREETGYIAGKLTSLGASSPNPAIMTNKVHFFLAEDLKDTGKTDPDSDEYVSTELVPEAEVIAKMGKPPYIHALMAAALNFYSSRTLA